MNLKIKVTLKLKLIIRLCLTLLIFYLKENYPKKVKERKIIEKES